MSPSVTSLSSNFVLASPSPQSTPIQLYKNFTYSSFITPATLISPLKPFNEYSGCISSDQAKQNSCLENKENRTYCDDFYGFESDVEVIVEPDYDVNEVTIEEGSEEDGEIPISPKSIIENQQVCDYFNL